MFVDRVKIEVQGGNGGNGCRSFRREKYIPLGGPDGGDGGQGGSVLLIAQAGVDSLASLSSQRFWRASPGMHGQGSNKFGKDGKDLTIHVPVGTIIYDARGGFILKDMTHEGDSVVVARGGEAGKGNVRFKTATNRGPTDFTPGGEGERREIILELKVIADVGLIGKPNAGKSTLLSRVTRARPEIADYPFTTKYPNLGIVRVDGDRQFVLADIPGLIEGASTGAGLGHEFLRHIERAGILIHLVEPAPMDETDPLENYRAIHNELAQYKQELVERPEIICVTKAELPSAAECRTALQEATGKPVMLISAVTGQGLNELMQMVMQVLDTQREAPSASA
jgi:GTPase